uniref:RAB3GAP2_N domain-containing protein n=1 Tax=Schistocephalus solidus TaxID=70667 RepID=A0A183SAL3_SCHSO
LCPLLTEAATAQQTVWLGCQNGDLFLHCSMTSRYRCLQTTRMPSGVTAICHFSGRVFVSLADGHIVVFRRQTPSVTKASSTTFCRDDAQARVDLEVKEVIATTTTTIPRSASQDTAITSTQHHLANSPDSSGHLRNDVPIGSELAAAVGGDGCALEGSWDLSEACVITCGPPQHAIKALVIVPPTLALWAAYGNQILVIDTTGFQKLGTCYQLLLYVPLYWTLVEAKKASLLLLLLFLLHYNERQLEVGMSVHLNSRRFARWFTQCFFLQP